MVDLAGFDANKVEPSTPFELLPAGKYLAAIGESEMKETQKKNGHFLNLQFQVLEGEHQGRKVWTRLNLDNPSEKAVQIAKGQLSAICRAVGVMTPKDSSELHDLPLTITVTQKERNDGKGMQNEITGFKPKEEIAGQPQQAERDVPPWQRK